MNNRKKIYKSVIFTGYKCNNRCRFCMEANKRNLQIRTTSEIEKEIIAARKNGADYLELIGGEMTIRPDIIKLIKFAKSLGFSTIMISTNGRMFRYEKLSIALFKAGLNSIVFSIHGHTSKIHDYLTQVPGSFTQLKTGIKNVQRISKKMGLNVHIGSNTCIVKQNYKFLPKIGKYIRSLKINDSEFIFVDPNEGGAYDHFKKLVPRISEIADYAHKCLDIGKHNFLNHWHIRYVPLCYFQNYLDQISELHEVATFHTEHRAQDFRDSNVEKSRREIGRKKTKKCKGCKLYNWCEGIWKTYLDYYGDKELKPVKKLSKKQLSMLYLNYNKKII